MARKSDSKKDAATKEHPAAPAGSRARKQSVDTKAGSAKLVRGSPKPQGPKQAQSKHAADSAPSNRAKKATKSKVTTATALNANESAEPSQAETVVVARKAARAPRTKADEEAIHDARTAPLAGPPKVAEEGQIPTGDNVPWYRPDFRRQDLDSLKLLALGQLISIAADLISKGLLMGFFTPLRSDLESAHDQFRKGLLDPGKRRLSPENRLFVLQDLLYMQELLFLTLTVISENKRLFSSSEGQEQLHDAVIKCYANRNCRSSLVPELNRLVSRLGLEQNLSKGKPKKRTRL